MEMYIGPHAHVTLPSQIIDRFSNKIMAIVGYESDMVFLTGKEYH